MNKNYAQVFIVIFCIACISQLFPSPREDWPFSFFGMYKGRVSPRLIDRVDVDLIHPGQPKLSLYSLRMDPHAIQWKIIEILTGFRFGKTKFAKQAPGDLNLSPEAQSELNSYLLEVIQKLDQLDRGKAALDQHSSLQVRFRRWKNFEIQRKDQADIDQIVYSAPLEQLRGAP